MGHAEASRLRPIRSRKSARSERVLTVAPAQEPEDAAECQHGETESIHRSPPCEVGAACPDPGTLDVDDPVVRVTFVRVRCGPGWSGWASEP